MARRRLAAAAGGAGLVVIVAAGALALAGRLPILATRAAVVAPRFVDETDASGIRFTYDGPFDDAVGGGVAAFDCDGDGLPELYIAGGSGPAALFHNDSTVGGPLRFSRIPSPVTDLSNVVGAYPIDVDADGITDLVLLRNGGNVVLRGLGGCRFERANEAWGLAPERYHTMAFAATWEAGSSWPTVAFGNYVDQSIADVSQWCEPNQLFRPAGRGLTTWAPPIDLKGWCTQSLLFSDWSRAGRPDLRVSNDRHYYRTTEGEEQLWRMEPGVAPREYGIPDGWQVVQVEGMGIASADLTGDGYPEVYLTSQAANRLQTLTAGPSQPTYGDIGASRQADVPHPFTGDTILPSTSWDPVFGDVNNDGRLDLLVTKGNITDQPDFAQRDPSDLLLGQPDGTYLEAADRAGIVRFDRGRGAALVDLNLDGRLDLVEVFYGAPVEVWRNAGPADGGASDGHWIQLQLTEDGPNRDAIGSWVEVRFDGQVIQQEVTIGGGHAGGQLGWIHVGLGAAASAQVRIQWPDGQWGPEQSIPADTFATIRRGASAPIPWTPGG
ncbi:MAG TPA: CRTAC1 family protein [Candidatus Binatus sp.]|nr:CRTAC1 family protein [Candidatus Binatus sp.]